MRRVSCRLVVCAGATILAALCLPPERSRRTGWPGRTTVRRTVRVQSRPRGRTLCCGPTTAPIAGFR